jgi:hypothetical protein
MKRYDLWFLFIAAMCLVIGVSVGIYMGATHDHTLSPVHAHINLLGWASLALFGLVYKCYPDLGRSWTATLHLALCGPSAVLMPAGIAFAVIYEAPSLAICASLMWLAGCVTFLSKFANMVVISATENLAAVDLH